MNQNKKRRIYFSLTVFIVFLSALFLVQKFVLGDVSIAAFPGTSNITNNNTYIVGTVGNQISVVNLTRNDHNALFNLTIGSGGPDKIREILIHVPNVFTGNITAAGGPTNLSFLTVNKTFFNNVLLNFSNHTLTTNETVINISFSTTKPQMMNLSNGANLTLSSFFRVNQTAGDEIYYTWDIYLADYNNSGYTKTSTVINTVDGQAPRITSVNVSDGNRTRTSGQLINGSTSFLEGGPNTLIRISATITDTFFKKMQN